MLMILQTEDVRFTSSKSHFLGGHLVLEKMRPRRSWAKLGEGLSNSWVMGAVEGNHGVGGL